MTRQDAIEDVCVVLVSYNSAGIIEEAIASAPPGCQVIVADNASGDASIVRAQAAGAEVVALGENLGFGTACNRGAAASSRPLVLFLNPDARLAPGALEALLKAANAHPDAVAFNPRIMEASGEQFFRTRSRALPPDRQGMPTTDRAITILSGAALLCRRDAFEAIGGFDERIFLYCEDDDLGARLAQAGGQLRYVHDAVVTHAGGGSSTPSAQGERIKAYHLMWSRRYVAAKHGRPVSRVGEAWRLGWRWIGAAATGRAGLRRNMEARLAALFAPL
ncbi:MAG: glycosyltransferase family 2 protein [Pseudomonadota bacterium]